MELMVRGTAVELTGSERMAVAWVIVLAIFFALTAAINLRAANPQRRGIQLVSLVVVLVLMTVAFKVSGAWAAAAVLALAFCAEAVHLALKRRRVA